MSEKSGPLLGLKIIELGGIGPAPFCGMLMADMGADVIRIDRNKPTDLGSPRPEKFDLLRRNRPSVSVDLKSAKGIETILLMVEQADAIIDPFRPGVTERLGLGPEDCMKRNEKLTYARMTGWGQNGTLAHTAGHDINYLSLSGVSNMIGTREKPIPPLNIGADMGGGAMFMAFGILASVFEAQRSGKGQVVDICMVEGAAYLNTAIWGLMAANVWTNRREDNTLDGGAPFYRNYQTKDGLFVSIGSIESKFYSIVLQKLGLNKEDLPDQRDKSQWPVMHKKFEKIFLTKTRQEWCEIFERTDACFAPVLNAFEAPSHPHNQARGSFITIDGIVQPGPTPKFSRTPSSTPTGSPELGENTEAGLAAWGFSFDEISDLLESGTVGCCG